MKLLYLINVGLAVANILGAIATDNTSAIFGWACAGLMSLNCFLLSE